MTDQMNKDEQVAENLKNCPFCGGGATFEHLENGRWSVGCADIDGDCMGFQSLTTFARKAEAITAWNTRALEASQAGAAVEDGEKLRRIDDFMVEEIFADQSEQPWRADDFKGDDAHLIDCIDAFLDLNDDHAMTPTNLGKGHHAYRLLCAARHRLATPPQAGQPQEAVAWAARDWLRAITARELALIPNEGRDKARRDRCQLLYPIPLYAAPPIQAVPEKSK